MEAAEVDIGDAGFQKARGLIRDHINMATLDSAVTALLDLPATIGQDA